MTDSTNFINTLLQRGVTGSREPVNRFRGFYPRLETAEAVKVLGEHALTPLKQGVNDKLGSLAGCSREDSA